MATRLLLVCTPPLTGPDVLALQRRLVDLGYDPGTSDATYGPLTAAAVRRFQNAAGLEIDGVVGPLTAARLAVAAPLGSPTGRRALVEARRWVGTGENPPTSNRTPFGAWYGLDGEPWCAIFLSYCFLVGAGVTIAAGFSGPGVGPKGCAYVPTIEAWLRSTGRWLGHVDPQPGDLAVYNWDGGPPDHIGIVECSAGATFTAIEGNTAIGNDSDGGRVLRRRRPLTAVDGFGRIALTVPERSTNL